MLWRSYFSVSGRMPRRWFLLFGVLTWFLVILLGVNYALSKSESVVNGEVSQEEIYWIIYLTGVLAYLALLAPAIKRFHDIGWSGWFFLLLFVLIIKIPVALLLVFMPGSKGDNDYGVNPRYRVQAAA
ncbi:DUF805 domain-containing protein [Microbulbifer guangxiensis]|uniref:DUF805 domain-containing protein n=1 Tax=Microbulbifer guangxiensis TaxID=2904249 RepID=UPI001F2657B2|nr:DUF805 domain-containing protein [Microbulbifer guangxiensis]